MGGRTRLPPICSDFIFLPSFFCQSRMWGPFVERQQEPSPPSSFQHLPMLFLADWHQTLRRKRKRLQRTCPRVWNMVTELNQQGNHTNCPIKRIQMTGVPSRRTGLIFECPR